MDDRFSPNKFIGADIAMNKAALSVASSLIMGLGLGAVMGSLFFKNPARVARFSGGLAVGLTISKESLYFQENKERILGLGASK